MNSGNFATICRGVDDPNLISLARHENSGENFVEANSSDWDHHELARADAEIILDGWIDLKVLKPFGYRNAITYFLRGQKDYDDELKL